MNLHPRTGILIVAGLAVILAGCRPVAPAPVAEPVPEVDCSRQELHPIAQSIADEFEVPYEQVMAWACGGESFDDILLALQTSELTQRAPEELLEMKGQGGWDKVWEALGLVAREAR